MADATHETKIVITGDEKPAVGSLTRVTKALHGVQSAVGKVMSAFGLFGLAMEGWRRAVELVQSLNERLHAAAKAAAEFKYADSMNAANAALDGSIDRQKRLNELLKEYNEEVSRTNDLRELKERNMREIEDARRAVNRAAEIAGVSDPRRRMEIQQQWRVEDEKRAKTTRRKEVDRQAEAEEDKAWTFDSLIRSAQEQIEDLKKEKKRFGTANIGNGIYYETGSEQFKARSEKLAKFDEQIRALNKSIKEWTEQRDFSQAKADELYAHVKRLEGLEKASPVGWQNVDEKLQFEREEEKKKAAEQERERKKADEESERKAKEAAADLKNRQDEQRRIEGDQIGIAASRSGDRLTAMGLGSGVAQSTRQNWKTVIDLLKKQIQVTQDNKPIEQSTVFE